MAKDGGQLKSAYELAMERLGGVEASPLTEEQKAKLAEIARVYESKVAEKKIVLERQIMEAARQGDVEAVQKLQDEMIAEIATLRQQVERDREAVRKGKQAGASRRRKSG